MKRAVWLLAWIAVAVWSVVAWGTYGLLDLFGDFAARNADFVTGNPEAVGLFHWVLSILRSVGFVAVVAIWGIVSLLFLGAAAVVSRLVERGPPAPRAPEWRGPVAADAPPPPVPPRGPPSDVREVMRRMQERR